MVRLEMKAQGLWNFVGDFDTASEAEFCIFDQRFAYRIIDSKTEKVLSQTKAKSRRELI